MVTTSPPQKKNYCKTSVNHQYKNFSKNKKFVLRDIFNPPRAPHFGGVWERHIRSCRDAFFAILSNNASIDDTFNTLLCEVEQFMNNCPLNAVSPNSGDIELLTPRHILLGRAYSNVPLSQPYPSPATISKQWKIAQQLADYLWNRFQEDCYPSFFRRQKWTALFKPPQPGSIVWILQEFTPRGLWPLGRIIAPISNGEEVEFSKDNQYRQNKLRTPREELILPANKLCALKINE